MVLSTGTESALLFLSSDEARLVDAMSGRIIPGDVSDPGACEALVYRFIDRALSGAYQQYQEFYRQGLAAVDRYARSTAGAFFADLTPEQQDSVLRDVEADRATGFAYPGPSAFFIAFRGHVVEGMFSDPAYGGNKDGVGWKLMGYPGTQYEYTADEMRPGADLSQKPIMTLADLQRTIQERGLHGFNGAHSETTGSGADSGR